MSFWTSESQARSFESGEIFNYTVDEDVVTFGCERGILRLKVLSTHCIRVTFNSGREFLNIPSFAVVNETVCKEFTVDEGTNCITIKTQALTVNLDKSNAKMIITDHEGRVLSEDDGCGFSWTKDTVTCQKRITEQDHFYGLGEKTGFLDKKGSKYTMWNTDDPIHTPDKDPLYKSIPFFIQLNQGIATGVFVDNTCRIDFDMGFEKSDKLSMSLNDSEFDYYFIYGPDIKDVIQIYSQITGTMELPPLWALGYQQCRWSYFPDTVVMNIADSFREKEIPCDVIYLDIDYMDEYRVFTWDANRFPDPETMLSNLKEKGFKVVTIVDPGVKKDAEYKVYQEGVKQGLFCKQLTGEVYHGKVWPGDAAFPDFTKEETRKWWGKQHSELLGKGVAGIWNDMNEPSDFSIPSEDRMLTTVPNDVIMENDGHPSTFRKYHNAYGLNMCRGTFEGFHEIKPQERPFMVTRSAYAGIQRYSCVWTGDNYSWWEHIAASMPMHMNIGMSGVPFVGGDVGGFQGEATPELFARWMQLGAFTPFFRAHSAIHTKQHEPWAFGEKVEEICKKYINMRYELLPYTYNEFYKASKTGLPIMRPLVLEYPHDENVYNLSDQFLFGENLMVAPVYRPSTTNRCVYIPEGTWYDYWTDEKYESNCYNLVNAQLDTLPLFIKAGSIIPKAPVMNYVGEKVIDTLYLDIYPGKSQTYSLYEDDGISKEYKKGNYSITEFEFISNENHYTFKIKPLNKGYSNGRIEYALSFHCIDKIPEYIECADVVSHEYHAQTRTFHVILKDKSCEQVIQFEL